MEESQGDPIGIFPGRPLPSRGVKKLPDSSGGPTNAAEEDATEMTPVTGGGSRRPSSSAASDLSAVMDGSAASDDTQECDPEVVSVVREIFTVTLRLPTPFRPRCVDDLVTLIRTQQHLLPYEDEESPPPTPASPLTKKVVRIMETAGGGEKALPLLRGSLDDLEPVQEEEPEESTQSSLASLSSMARIGKRKAATKTQDQLATDSKLEAKIRRRNIWNDLRLSVIVYNALAIPWRMANGDDVETWQFVLDLLLDVVVYYNIYLTFKTPIEERGIYSLEKASIRRRYFRTWFIPDCLSGMPLELVAWMAGSKNPAWRVNRLLYATHAPKFYKVFFQHHFATRFSPVFHSLLGLVVVLMFTAHIAGCFWVAMFNFTDHDDITVWLGDDLSYQSRTMKYLRGFDLGIKTLIGVSVTSNFPLNDIQFIFLTLHSIVGVSVYATLLTMVMNLVENLDIAKNQFLERMDQMRDTLKYLKIPEDEQKNVMGYYRELWKARAFSFSEVEEERLLAELPQDLAASLVTEINLRMLRKVPLFSHILDRPEFLEQLAAVLTPRVALPQSFVVKKGDMGDEMFFIAQGTLAVIDGMGRQVHQFTSGDIFGELAMVFGEPRSANVTAVSYSHLYVLNKAAFERIADHFPDCFAAIMETAMQRRAANQQQATQPPPEPVKRRPSAFDVLPLRAESGWNRLAVAVTSGVGWIRHRTGTTTRGSLDEPLLNGEPQEKL